MLTANAMTAAAQSAITLTQSNFPATPATQLVYSQAAPAGVTAPTAGTNRAWDYRGLTATGQSNGIYTAPPASAVFPTATRAYGYTITLGIITAQAQAVEAVSATGIRYLGFQMARQRFSLATVTGSATDSLVVPAQAVPVNQMTFAFPTTMGTVTRQVYRTATTGLVTVGVAGLSRTPLRLVQRVVSVDSVAGWGTMRVPTSSGPSAAMPALMMRQRSIEIDSFYLAGQPAPALLLAALGLQQGVRYNGYSDVFYRANSSQTLAEFYYPTSTYQSPNEVYYSREASVVTATKPSLASELGGLLAYPNPLANGQLVVAAGNGGRHSVRLRVHDMLGRLQATAPAYTGEPTAVLDGLPAGTYLLEIASPTGASSTVRIVRN